MEDDAGLIEDSTGVRAIVDPNQLEGPTVLPHLRKFVMLNTYLGPKPEMIVEMLEAICGTRVMGEEGHFCFEVPSSLSHPWSPGDLVRLKRLAKSGFEFDVVLGSHHLDSLSLFP